MCQGPGASGAQAGPTSGVLARPKKCLWLCLCCYWEALSPLSIFKLPLFKDMEETAVGESQRNKSLGPALRETLG